tara:strand:- start:1636 stop:1956 length:321 start_codon:yes stop_codon:yes gene_type:complete
MEGTMRKILDHDEITGITKLWHVDPATGSVTVETRQDITSIANANKRARNEIDARTPHGDVSKVASLPLAVYYDLKRKGILDDKKALRKWLNDSNNQVFRTREATL